MGAITASIHEWNELQRPFPCYRYVLSPSTSEQDTRFIADDNGNMSYLVGCDSGETGSTLITINETILGES